MRVTSDGDWTKRWLSLTATHTLSVRSGRLLVTCFSHLTQFDADGNELLRVRLDGVMAMHAVESPSGTFIVSRYSPVRGLITEVNPYGEVLRQFSGSLLLPLGLPPHIAVDSRGNVFLADKDHCRILQLDARLMPRRVVVNKHQMNCKEPKRLCYDERSGQLLVVSGSNTFSSIAVFDVLRRH